MEHFNHHTARLGLLCERKKRNNAKEPPWETGEAFFYARMRVGMLPAEAEKAVRQTTMGRSLAAPLLLVPRERFFTVGV